MGQPSIYQFTPKIKSNLKTLPFSSTPSEETGVTARLDKVDSELSIQLPSLSLFSDPLRSLKRTGKHIFIYMTANTNTSSLKVSCIHTNK